MTVRRHTRRLVANQRLSTRRGRNCVVYTIRAETPPPPDAAKEPSPASCCPKHKRSRLSWMSQHTAGQILHCPVRAGTGHCSWLHHETLGVIREPELTELTLPQVLAMEKSAKKPAPADPPATPVPVEPPEHSASLEQEIWQRTLAKLSNLMQPHDLARYLGPATPRSVNGQEAVIAVPNPRAIRWLEQPIQLGWVEQAVSEILGRPAQVKYVPC